MLLGSLFASYACVCLYCVYSWNVFNNRVGNWGRHYGHANKAIYEFGRQSIITEEVRGVADKLMDDRESKRRTIRDRKDNASFKLPPSARLWLMNASVFASMACVRVRVRVRVCVCVCVLYVSMCARMNTIPLCTNRSWQLTAGKKASFTHNSAVIHSRSTAGLPVWMTIWKVIRNGVKKKTHRSGFFLFRIQCEQGDNYIDINMTLYGIWMCLILHHPGKKVGKKWELNRLLSLVYRSMIAHLFIFNPKSCWRA